MKKSLVTMALVGSVGFSIVGAQANPVDDAQTTENDVEIILVPVIDPVTGKLSNTPCPTAPYCAHDGATINSENEKDEQE